MSFVKFQLRSAVVYDVQKLSRSNLKLEGRDRVVQGHAADARSGSAAYGRFLTVTSSLT